VSPLKIHMLLHYYARGTDYAAWASVVEPEHATSSAVREAMEFLVDQGMLKSKYGDISWAINQAAVVGGDDSPIFSITEKGRAMVGHLCAVQVPVCQWVQPSQ
jgi:hypothetical protein